MSTSDSARRRDFAARVFGFDVFLSFALGPPPRGTLHYATDLARRLRERGLTVFFSEDELPPGEQLSSGLRRALHRARLLMVVVNRETLADPRWIRTEVAEFQHRHPERPVVVISVDGALEDPTVAEGAKTWLQAHDKKWLDETGEAVRSGVASSGLIEALLMAPRRTKSNVRWRWLVRGVLSVLLVLAFALGASTYYALLQREASAGSMGQARAALGRAAALRLAEESAQMFSGTHPEPVERGLQQFAAAMRLPSGAETEIESSLLTVLLQLRQLRKVIPAGTEIAAVAFSPDGRHVVAGGSDGTLRIWDAETGRLSGAPLVGHEKPVSSVAYSPDGRRIVSGADDSSLRIWSAATGQPIGGAIEGHDLNVNCVAYSPDGRQIVSGSSDWTLRVWDAETGRPIGEPLRHEDNVDAVAFSADGRRIVSGSRDTTLRIWDAQTHELLGVLEGAGFVAGVAFSPDGRQVVSGGWDKNIHAWDVETKKPLGSPLVGHTGPITSIAYSADGRFIVSGSNDKTVRLWDAETKQPIGSPLVGHKGPVTAVAVSRSGNRIVSGGADSTLQLWTSDIAKPLGASLEHKAPVAGAGFSPDGRRIASGAINGSLYLWDASTLETIGVSPVGSLDGATSLAWSRDGRFLVIGQANTSLRLWDVASWRAIGEPLVGHPNGVMVRSVAYSPGGRQVASTSAGWASWSPVVTIAPYASGMPRRERQ